MILISWSGTLLFKNLRATFSLTCTSLLRSDSDAQLWSASDAQPTWHKQAKAYVFQNVFRNNLESVCLQYDDRVAHYYLNDMVSNPCKALYEFDGKVRSTQSVLRCDSQPQQEICLDRR